MIICSFYLFLGSKSDDHGTEIQSSNFDQEVIKKLLSVDEQWLGGLR